MLNKIIIMGRLTRDPELRRTQSGTAVTSFSIACDRDFKSQSGEKETDFIDKNLPAVLLRVTLAAVIIFCLSLAILRPVFQTQFLSFQASDQGWIPSSLPSPVQQTCL